LIDLNLLVNEILQLLQKQIGENKAIIEVGALPVLHANRSSLIQVFQNLVGNSLKYKRKDIATQIKITATEQDKYWQFSVADNGIGIEEEYFTKIFIIFQRLHNQNEFSGTGIGLAITKKIIEKLGGKIWLQSEPGRGTTFYFTIKK
jgi:light-regulated signal transduction histidine kinase (bacteriophytochrome)